MARQSRSRLLSSGSKVVNGQQPRVALFGEVLADAFPDREVLGGAPFNVARHLQAFGVHAVLITRVGDDALRGQIAAAMARYGMDASGVQFDHKHPTGRVQVHLLPEGGHRFEILPDQAYDFVNSSIAHLVTLSVKPDLVYFGTLAQRNYSSRTALNAVLRSCRALRLLDLNLRAPWYDPPILQASLQRADVVKLNEEELAELAELLHLRGKGMEQSAASLIKLFELERVVVTCGADGAWQLNVEGEEVRVQAPGAGEITLVDTVGAGDGFASVLILGELLGWPADLTMARASAFAAAVCGLRGAIPDKDDFYEPFLRLWFDEG